MAEYGGLGGIWDGRQLNTEDLFEMAVARQLGERMKTDDQLCRDMWSALANQDWRHKEGDLAGYSFRAAGDLIAAVRGSGMYLDWYCSGPYATVSEEIAEALAQEGWYPELGNAKDG